MNGKMPENVPGRSGKEPSVSRSSAQNFLEQSWRLNEEIDCKIEQLDVLNALAGKTTGTLSGMPHAAGHEGSKLEDIIVKIVDLQEEINADIDRLVDLKTEIIQVINSVPDEDCRCVLEKHFLQGKSYSVIGLEMKYDKDYVYKKIKKALKKIQIPESVL